MSNPIDDRRSLYLLLSLLLIILLSPFLETHRAGEFFLLIALFATLIIAILELHGKRTLRWLAIIVATPIVFIELIGVFYPSRSLLILDYALLAAFFGFSSVGLFAYLGKPGAISSGRIYASVSLYLMLATFWFALYNLMEAIYPASFVQTGAPATARIPRAALLYFSLITLTTVGYGDIVPVTPAARVFAALEGAAGVLYIAITVARLVAAYQSAARE
ncbi:MAG: potassium channel family protein [Candidatus Acidiferrales bacterium]